MKTVVTGAGGHIGGVLVRRLLQDGCQVRAVIRNDARALKGLDVEIVKADVLDEKSLENAFDGAETVFHLAARISISGDEGGLVFNTNVNGPKNVVAACLKKNVKRLVHFSSVHAHCQTPVNEPLDETRCYVKMGEAPAYDNSKAMGEKEIFKGIENGLDAVIVNPTGVIGPYDFKPSRMGEVFLDLYYKKLAGLINGGFNWVDVRDVANGAVAAAAKGKTGQKYLLGGHWRSIEDVSKIAFNITGVKPPGFVTPMWLARAVVPFVETFSKVTNRRPLFTSESLCALRANQNICCDKAKNDLGFAPRAFEETVKDIYDWFEKAGRLK